MPEENSDQSQLPKTLRQRAEEMARTSSTDIAGMSTDDVQRLVHELQIHQIELELQNEELRDAQVELAHSHDRYADLYEFAPVGYVTLNKDGKILEANLTAAKMLGVERQALLRTNIAAFVIPASQDACHLHRQSVFSNETKQICELEMKKADGAALAVRLESIAFGTGTDRRCRTALIDLTAERLVEQQLQESEHRYRRLTEAVIDYIFTVRIEHGSVVDTIHGPNCEAITGYTPDEFAANKLLWISIVPPEDRAVVEQHIQQLIVGEQPPPLEHRLRRKDGEVRWVLRVTSPRFNDQGHLIAYDGLLRDITERKQAEKELQRLNEELEQRVNARTTDLRRRTDQLARQSAELEESEVRFRQLAENVDQIFWLTDPDKQQMLYVNPAFERIFGRTCKSLYENPQLFVDAAHPDDRQRLIDSFPRQREGNYAIKFRIVRPDGGVRWLRTRAEPVRGMDGQVVRIAGISEDITKQKRAEEELRRAHEVLENLFNTAQTVVLVLDTQGRIERFNPYLEELSGWRLDDVQGQDWFDAFLPERDRDRIRGLFGRAHRGERTRGNVNPIVTKDGRELDIEWYDAPLTSAEGKLIGLLCTGQDITERLRSQKALREREERMRAILNTAADAIVTIDQRGIIESVNPATEQMFGYTRDELIGQNVKILMPPPYCDEHDGYIARYQETGEARIIGTGREVVAKRQDGSTFPVDLAVSQVDHLGLFTGIIRDISERVEAQEKLLQSERLAAIGEAMTGLAHESRNALQRSQACLDLLAERLEEQPETLELLETIQRAQDELHRLYEEVRAYAAPIQLKPRYRHVGEILRNVWNDLSSARKGRDTRFNEDAVCDDLHCEVDPFAVGQVFRNILENAVQACGDPVEIQVVYAEANHEDAPALTIAIRDNGPGISPEQAEHVFHSFFTTKTQGTGLGMAIAQRIVLAHGGQIAVIPDSAQGAEFLVTLPRRQS